MGLEPTTSAWKANMLPLHQWRLLMRVRICTLHTRDYCQNRTAAHMNYFIQLSHIYM